MTDLIDRLRLGDGTSPDHWLLLEAADALEKSVECMCGICKLGPQQRTWVSLTDEEIRECFAHVEGVTVSDAVILISVVRTTQASLKEKNEHL